MKVLKNQLSGEIDTVAEESFDKKCVLFNDKIAGYIDINQHVKVYISEESTKDSTVKSLPCMHVAIYCHV